MKTQADSVDPCREWRGELGKSLDYRIYRAGPGETCGTCNRPALLVAVRDSEELFTCCPLTELRDRLKRGLRPCPNLVD